jgi:hypothetical protein
VAKAKLSPASTAAYPAAPCLHPLRAGRRSGATPLPKKQRRKRKKKEEESTHTNYTNKILLGASVSDHPQNFATKEANLSPTHWQTPAKIFLLAERLFHKGFSQQQIEWAKIINARHRPRNRGHHGGGRAQGRAGPNPRALFDPLDN